METIKTILVPVDLSDCSFGVFREAAGVAQHHQAKLVLLHVLETPSGVDGNAVVVDGEGRSVTAYEALEQDALTQLKGYVLPEGLEGIGVTQRVVRGKAVDQILKVAQREAADLIVMGTHGRTGLTRLLLGSVAETVTRKASIPVMTYRSHHRPDCEAGSCGWCTSGRTGAQAQLQAELDG